MRHYISMRMENRGGAKEGTPELYFTDPDGNPFEFFCETVHDNEEGKRVLKQYNAPSDPFPLEPLRD